MIKSYNDLEIGETSSAYYQTNFLGSRPCQKDVRGHTACVNSISLSNDEKYLTSGGDDGHVYIWRVNEMILDKTPKPKAIMQSTHALNIFTTEMSNDNSIVYSGGRDEVVLKHDIETGQLLLRDASESAFDDNVYSIKQSSVQRIDDNLLAITRGSRVVTCDTRCNDKVIICQKVTDRFHNSEFNPEVSYLFLACSMKKGPLIYDLRNVKKPIEGYPEFYGDRYFSYFETFKENIYSTWSPSGKSLASLHSKQSPIYYDLNARVQHVCNDEAYVNRKTMKSLAFLDERTIATGSDENTIFIWKIPEVDNIDLPNDLQYFQQKTLNRSTKTLVGHRSIPNQIRYCESSEVIFSSGVENSIKIWSMKTLPWSYDEPFVRRKREEYDDIFREIDREKEERRAYEASLEEGAMEGRATWEDVFGGDAMTSESRATCESFERDHMEIDDDDDNYSDDFGWAIDPIRIRRHRFFANLLNDSESDDDNEDDGPLRRRNFGFTERDFREIINAMRNRIAVGNAIEDAERENDFDADDEDTDEFVRNPLVGGSDDEDENAFARRTVRRLLRELGEETDGENEEEEEEEDNDDGDENENDEIDDGDEEDSYDEEESDDNVEEESN